MGWTKVQHGKKDTACSKLHSASCCCEAASKHARSNQAHNKAPSRQLTLRVGRHLARLGVLHRETTLEDVLCQSAKHPARPAVLPRRHYPAPPSCSPRLRRTWIMTTLGCCSCSAPASSLLSSSLSDGGIRPAVRGCSPAVAAAVGGQEWQQWRRQQRSLQQQPAHFKGACRSTAAQPMPLVAPGRPPGAGRSGMFPLRAAAAPYTASIPHRWAGDSQSPRLHRAGPDRAPCP